MNYFICLNVAFFLCCLIQKGSFKQSGDSQILPCDKTRCNAAGCLCCGPRPPNDWQPVETPKIVMVTFSGSLNAATYNLYNEALQGISNPNGCPASATFFVQHQYSDYSTIAQVYNNGHDLGINSISSGTPVQNPDDNEEIFDEIATMKEYLQKYALVPEIDIKGYRAPWNRVGEDAILQILNGTLLTFDSSLTNRVHDIPVWPYSFDYSSNQCPGISYTPTVSFPGIWQFPINDFIDGNGRLCASLDGCYYNQSTIPDALALLRVNNKYHEKNNVPLMIVVTAGWLASVNNSKQLNYFLQEITKNENAYVVTINQALEWFLDPTLSKDILSFQPWKCKVRKPIQCEEVVRCQCQLEDKSSLRFTFCSTPDAQVCPPGYPWINGTFRGTCS